MLDIVRTGRIVGRGNFFSGDRRDHLVFFGNTSVEDVSHSGEDTLRAVYSSPAFLAEWAQIHEETRRLDREWKRFSGMLSDYGYDVPKGQRVEFNRVRKARESLLKKESKLRDKMYAAAKALKAKNRKKFGATSFTLELEGAPGGIAFTGEDSAHGRDEVGFLRDPGVSADYIRRVHVLMDGKVIDEVTYPELSRALLRIRD
jgi:hypothetical protein